MRDLSTELVTQISAAALQPILLAVFYFDSHPLRFWSGLGEIEIDGEIYTGAGSLLSISEISESTEMQANGMSFTLTGIPTSMISLAFNEDYQGRGCELLISAIDGFTVLPPYPLFGGLMDVMDFDIGAETTTITLNAESKLVLLNKAKVSRYTAEDQKRTWPDDAGLDFIAVQQNKEITWGR